jgi:hypothetical protein
MSESSNMLEQAIVDANTLKEVAIKNAEEKILEKYSDKIKEAINLLLEQEDPSVMDNEDPNAMSDLGGMGGGLEPSLVAKDVPLAATDGQKLCSCPDAEEEIEINFADLEKQIGGQDPSMGQEIDMGVQAPMGLENKVDEKDLELDEETMLKLAEELEVDIEPVPSGWRGVPQSTREDTLEVALAQEQDDEIKKENEKLRKALEDTKKESKSLQEQKEKLSSDNKKYVKLLNELKTKLESLVVTNAKLLYSNRVLNNDSLNERQKKQIVENIQKSKNVGEAKVLFESLQGTINSSPKKKLELLSEAIVKPSTVLVPHKEVQQTSDMSKRMKVLAGIK